MQLRALWGVFRQETNGDGPSEEDPEEYGKRINVEHVPKNECGDYNYIL